MDKISVIIPVYNIEKYVKKCILSVVNQTYSNLEILLVDDGSTDLSGIICDNMSELDDRIKVIHKKNGGLSDARNVGMENATGEYISFIDGDDYIEPEMRRMLCSRTARSRGRTAMCTSTTHRATRGSTWRRRRSTGLWIMCSIRPRIRSAR